MEEVNSLIVVLGKIFQTSFFGNKYVQSILLIILFYILSKLLLNFVHERVIRIFEKSESRIDDKLFSQLNSKITWLIVFFALKIAATIILKENYLNLGQKILTSFIILTIGGIIAKTLSILVNHWNSTFSKRAHIDRQHLKLFNKILIVFIYTLAFMFILQSWNIQIGPLITSLGIAGVAVAFALQKTLGNLFGGISIILDRTAEEGDFIELEDGTMGTIMDVGMRSTKIKLYTNETIIIPTGLLADQKIKNYKFPSIESIVVVPFSVAYGSDIEKVKKLALKQARKVTDFNSERDPFVRFSEMGSSSLNFNLNFWVNDFKNRWTAKDEANTLLYNALNKAGISIPFPQLDVHMKKK